MTKHLLRDLDDLKKKLLLVGGLVEGAIERATTALLEKRPELARQVAAGDAEIDRREVRIEEDCLKILALHQPVAADLRFIVAVLKVNNDLERMGDLAANIAERAIDLCACRADRRPPDLGTMVETVRRMVRDTLEALIRTDVALARRVVEADDLVDKIHRDMFAEVRAIASSDPELLDAALLYLSGSRNLERIADQCTNIAEDVIFLVEGEIVRHRSLR